jgi:peptidoglycan/xylan/chitin deacetylase (PgdA/CDA1 family)
LRPLLILLITALVNAAWASDHLNILVYHHVSENTPASTSISPKKFNEHLQFFADEGFEVVDLEAAMASLKNGNKLPEKAIAITFDDGYENIYQNAWPMLKEFNYPFTLFVATDAIDQQFGNMLSWDQLREMKAAGVTIANHSTDHDYLVRYRKRDAAWLNNVKNNIEQAQTRLVEELGPGIPKWFAYPYGEFSDSLKEALETMGYLGFAQHSGGVWQKTDMQAIPRFAAAGIYSNTNSLLTKLNSRPMPVDESTLPDMVTQEQKPVLVADLFQRNDFAKSLKCFIDGQWQDSTWPSDKTFRVTTESELGEGRHRYNCTAKSNSGSFYYWFSKPWLVYGLTDSTN